MNEINFTFVFVITCTVVQIGFGAYFHLDSQLTTTRGSSSLKLSSEYPFNNNNNNNNFNTNKRHHLLRNRFKLQQQALIDPTISSLSSNNQTNDNDDDTTNSNNNNNNNKQQDFENDEQQQQQPLSSSSSNSSTDFNEKVYNENDKSTNNEDSNKNSEKAAVEEDYQMDASSITEVHLGEKCDGNNRKCVGEFVKCRNGICNCQDKYVRKTHKPNDCEEYYVVDAPLRGPCNRTHRCMGDYVECRDGTCSCMRGYTVSASERDICRERVQIHIDGPKTDPTMIGVIVGLALMSVTLCVVMRLFAKARFRENRTIFNTANPRLMNVSLKKVKKQISKGNGQGKRGSLESVQISEGGRQMSVTEKDRSVGGGGRVFNHPEKILSTSIDEEPSAIGKYGNKMI